LKREDANFEGDLKRTRPVDEAAVNAFGLYGMHGNVRQLCSSGFDKYPNTAQTDPDPAGDGELRVVRGGSWCWSERHCRSAFRSHFGPDIRNFDEGFRLVLVPSGQDK